MSEVSKASQVWIGRTNRVEVALEVCANEARGLARRLVHYAEVCEGMSRQQELVDEGGEQQDSEDAVETGIETLQAAMRYLAVLQEE